MNIFGHCSSTKKSVLSILLKDRKIVTLFNNMAIDFLSVLFECQTPIYANGLDYDHRLISYTSRNFSYFILNIVICQKINLLINEYVNRICAYICVHNYKKLGMSRKR
ncbi:hypothetical protein P343_15745 [Sporolactobacillus laevolacticus DSM 442]|uniref:Uncharacterized protein n=1 Tax=Sporolactobacillus laevolacticus DSM 442 TaxID=1395513 RepID=V6IUN5_9BACL|nr:hypothetical protein P343_15745 [Sporolactobacillus laevolacticus DSM 442]